MRDAPLPLLYDALPHARLARNEPLVTRYTSCITHPVASVL
jgi:hypothetical protein